MNEKNFDYLKDTLKYLGFGEGLNSQLMDRMKEGAKEFVLGHSSAFNEKKIDASLFFRRSDSSDMYFLNKWTGTLGQYEGSRSQSFYINKGQGVTLKEGFNLLDGRAVHKELTDKEGQTYKAWLQLDKEEKDAAGNYKVNQYHEKYGFDLDKKLGELPIKQLEDPAQKAILMKSLEKGDLQLVNFEKNGQSDLLFVAANPRFKAIEAYDQAGKGIAVHNLERRYGLPPKAAVTSDVRIIGHAGSVANQQGKDEGVKPVQKVENQTKKPEKQRPEKAKESALLPKKRLGKSKGQHL